MTRGTSKDNGSTTRVCPQAARGWSELATPFPPQEFNPTTAPKVCLLARSRTGRATRPHMGGCRWPESLNTVLRHQYRTLYEQDGRPPTPNLAQLQAIEAHVRAVMAAQPPTATGDTAWTPSTTQLSAWFCRARKSHKQQGVKLREQEEVMLVPQLRQQPVLAQAVAPPDTSVVNGKICPRLVRNGPGPDFNKLWLNGRGTPEPVPVPAPAHTPASSATACPASPGTEERWAAGVTALWCPDGPRHEEDVTPDAKEGWPLKVGTAPAAYPRPLVVIQSAGLGYTVSSELGCESLSVLHMHPNIQSGSRAVRPRGDGGRGGRPGYQRHPTLNGHPAALLPSRPSAQPPVRHKLRARVYQLRIPLHGTCVCYAIANSTINSCRDGCTWHVHELYLKSSCV